MNCGECLINNVEIVALVDGVCPKCKTDYTADDGGRAELERAKARVVVPANVRQFQKSLWIVACIAQGTDPKSKFVVLDDNEASQAYNAFNLALDEAITLAAQGNSAIVYQSKLNTNHYGAACTLPTFGLRVGDRIYSPLKSIR